MHFLYNKRIQQTVVGLLIFIFVFSPLIYPAPKTNAQVATYDAAAAMQRTVEIALEDADLTTQIAELAEEKYNTILNTISSASLKALGIKEWTLDNVAWALAKAALSAGIRSTTRWISSGFQGAPMFVTDPQGFLLNIADEKAGEILYGSSLRFLCSPINIQLSLKLYYQSIRNRNPLRCTISGAAANVERFVNGNFSAGGWPAWLDVSVNPMNSSMGGALAGQIAFVTNINTEQQERQRQWSSLGGFLDSEECTVGPDGVEKCVKVTPGEVIADTMSFGVTVGDRSLIEADEINELIGALMGQMVKAGFQGVKGIFGLGQAGGYSSAYSDSFSGGGYSAGSGGALAVPCAQRSYLDQMSDPECDPTLSSTNTSIPFSGSGSIFQAITDEESFQAMHRRIISAATSVINESERRGEGCSINDGIVADAEGYIATASSTILSSQVRVLELRTLQIQADQNDAQKLEIMTQFANMIGSGSIRTGAENIRELNGVENTLKEINNNASGIPNGQGGQTKEDTSLRSRIQDCPRAPDPEDPEDIPIYNDGGGSEGGGDGG